ncbi:hypothetical protein [Clostridium tertium]|jgi:hypothetical protein|uniref:hypothetical protein n=1 Tax=Clostridium tertium TaxID=1559 RepID=UPI000BE395CF|nr:hypothetical protein [Clostridium tertium]
MKKRILIIISILAFLALLIWGSWPIYSIVEVKEYTDQGTLVLEEDKKEIIIRNYPNKLRNGMKLKVARSGAFDVFSEESNNIEYIDEAYGYLGENYYYEKAEYENFKDSEGEYLLLILKNNESSKEFKKIYYGKVIDYNYDYVKFDDGTEYSYVNLEYVVRAK